MKIPAFRGKWNQRVAHLLSDVRGSALLTAVVVVSVLVILGGGLAGTMLYEYRDATRQQHWTEGLYLAEAGMQRSWNDIKYTTLTLPSIFVGADATQGTGDDGILSFGSSVALGGGTYSVVVTDNDDGDGDLFTDLDQLIRVTATGNIPGPQAASRTVNMYLEVITPGVPNDLRSAITAKGTVATLGNLEVDGRNHDIDGIIIPSDFASTPPVTGTYAVVTGSSDTSGLWGGSSTLGGTDVVGQQDYPLSNLQNDAIVQSGAANLPTEPDGPNGVFSSLPSGELKRIAQAGIHGQYATDPNYLNWPLSGVTYVELPPGGSWGTAVFLDGSSGILVVHSSTTDSSVANLSVNPSSPPPQQPFRGVIIADDIDRIHCVVVGAVYSLIDGSHNDCVGNGTGAILYSIDAIVQAQQTSFGNALTMKSWFH